MLFSPLLLSQSCPRVHNTRPAAPIPPIKDEKEITDPRKQIQPILSSENFLNPTWLGKVGESKS